MAVKRSKKTLSRKAQAPKRPARKPKPRKVQAVPAGYHNVTAYLAVKDAAAAIRFYEQAFGAAKLQHFQDGERIAHAELKLGDSHLMLADEYPELGFHAPAPGTVSSVSIMLYVGNVDEVVGGALRAGARLERPVADQFYGDRLGTVIDPFGYRWYVATHVEDVSPEEMERRKQAMQQGS